jgi:predicted phage-related endonuclease
MRNLNVGLTAEQRAARKLGASCANKLMAGTDEELIALWQELRGEREPEDLSNVLAVMMGSWTEELNRYWFEKQTGIDVSDDGKSVFLADHPYMTCTLDGLCHGGAVVFEAKHVGGFENTETILQRYTPQCQWQMAVTGASKAYLSIFSGTSKWEFHEIERDDIYICTLIDRAKWFWACVESGEPPAALPAVATALPTKMREVDMTGNNAWADAAFRWLDYKDAADAFKIAVDDVKKLVEADVSRATGHGIEAKRDKRGISIKPAKQAKEAA